METTKTKFWEVSPGNKSNGRRNASIIVWSALLMAQEILLMSALSESTSLITAAASAGTIFLTIATPALVYTFNQKRQEIKDKSP